MLVRFALGPSGARMDRRKKPLEVTASSVSAGTGDSTGLRVLLASTRQESRPCVFTGETQTRPSLTPEPELAFSVGDSAQLSYWVFASDGHPNQTSLLPYGPEPDVFPQLRTSLPSFGDNPARPPCSLVSLCGRRGTPACACSADTLPFLLSFPVQGPAASSQNVRECDLVPGAEGAQRPLTGN